MKKNKMPQQKKRKGKVLVDQSKRNPDYVKPITAISFFVIGLRKVRKTSTPC